MKPALPNPWTTGAEASRSSSRVQTKPKVSYAPKRLVRGDDSDDSEDGGSEYEDGSDSESDDDSEEAFSENEEGCVRTAPRKPKARSKPTTSKVGAASSSGGQVCCGAGKGDGWLLL